MLATAAAAIFAIHSLYLERGQRNIASWFAQNLAQEEPEQAESSGFVPWRDTHLTRFWGCACAEVIAAAVEMPLLSVSPSGVGRGLRWSWTPLPPDTNLLCPPGGSSSVATRAAGRGEPCRAMPGVGR